MKRREVLAESLHLLVLAGLAVAQPVYDLLARHPGFFVARRAEPIDLLLLTGALSLFLPAALAGFLALLRRDHPKAGLFCHRLAVAVLSGVLALQALKRLEQLPGEATVALALAVGGAAAVAYHQLEPARLLLTLLTPVIVLFPALFLFHPSVFKILRPAHAEVAPDLEVRSDDPIFLLVFDALPTTSLMDDSGRIDGDRYPSFARLAESATWYRNATTVSRRTIEALPAILTGSYPDPGRLPSFYDHPHNLFTLLAGSYRLEVFEHIAELCPVELCPRPISPAAERLRHLASDLAVVYGHLLLPPDLAASLPRISQTWEDFGAGEHTPGGRDRSRKHALLLDAVDPARPRTLYFLHSLFPHQPFHFLPSGKRYSRVRDSLDRRGLERGRWSGDEWAVLQNHRRHLLQVGWVDALLGQLLDRLRTTGLFDRSLIVVTADHGVSFRAGDSCRGLTDTNFIDVMSIPLLIKRPRQTTGEIDDSNVESIDVLPTLAEYLGVEIPWPVDGVSVADVSRRQRSTKVCYAGEKVEHPVSAFDSRPEAARRISAAFGRGGFDDMLRAGPHAELIGRRLEPAPPGSAGLSARLADPSLFREVDPESGFVPALVEGFLERPRRLTGRLDLAIGINGVVAATTRTYLEPAGRGLLGWSALVPEEAFRAGANDVEVRVIQPTECGPVLEPTSEAG